MYSLARAAFVRLLLGAFFAPDSNKLKLSFQSGQRALLNPAKTIMMKKSVAENTFLLLPVNVMVFILNVLARNFVIKKANASDGTKRNLSAIVAPLRKNRLFVGEVVIKKNKMEKERMGLFLNCTIAIIKSKE